MVAASLLVSRYRALGEALTVMARRAKSARPRTCNEPARSCLQTSLLERLSHDLEAMARARGPLIQEQDAVVGPRHLSYANPCLHARICNARIGREYRLEDRLARIKMRQS